MICPKCKKDNDNSNIRCEFCGERLIIENALDEMKKIIKKDKEKLIESEYDYWYQESMTSIMVLIVSFVIFFFAILSFNGSKDTFTLSLGFLLLIVSITCFFASIFKIKKAKKIMKSIEKYKNGLLNKEEMYEILKDKKDIN